jgi:hypothetical protein
MRFITLAFIFLGLIGFLQARAEESIKILAGGPSSAKLLLSEKAALEKAAGAPLDLSISPMDNSITVLVKGMVDGIITGNPEETFAVAEKKGLGKINPDDYQAHPISEVTLKIGVHPDNPVVSLTHDQLKDIFTGKIKTWEPITGKKEAITVLMARNYQLALKVTRATYNDGEPLPVEHSVIDKDGLVRGIQKDRGAIGVFTEREGIEGFMPKFIRSDAKSTTYLLMRKKARPAAQKLFDYVKSQPKAVQD